MKKSDFINIKYMLKAIYSRRVSHHHLIGSMAMYDMIYSSLSHYYHTMNLVGFGNGRGLEHVNSLRRVTHICVSKIIIICSENGLSPGRHQAIM